MISLNTRIPEHSGRFVSRHQMLTATGDGRHLVTVSGAVLAHFRGPAQPADPLGWQREQLSVRVDFDAILPGDRWFHVEQWVPYMALTAFEVQVLPENGPYGNGVTHYPAVALDSFRLQNPNFGPTKDLELRADLAVKPTASQLFRLAYHVTLQGRLVAPPPAP